MVTLLHVADLHLGLSRYGTPAQPRVEDYIATWGRFVDAAIERRVGAAVIAGDTFNTRLESPEVRAAFVAGIVRLRAAGIEVILIPGNHDGQTTIGDAESHSLRWFREAHLDGVHIYLTPTTEAVMTREGPLLVSALPYPHKRAFDKQLADLDPESRVLEAGRRVEGIIATMAATETRPAGAPHIFVGHLTVGGSTAGAEVTMRFTWDVAIRAEVLDAFDYAALGHIHRQQQLGSKAWYAGSPEYSDFGEVGQVKGFLHVTVEHDRTPIVEVIPSGARPMVDLTIRELPTKDPAMPDGIGPTKWYWDDGPPGTVEPGSIVRLTLHPLTAAAGARVARKLLEHFAAASFVKVDQVRPAETRAARVDVSADLGVIEATTRWLTAHDITPDRYIEVARELIAGQAGG